MNRKRARYRRLGRARPEKTADFLRALMDEKQNA